jgi:uncharacterized protein YndB with AHSA1/START domain
MAKEKFVYVTYIRTTIDKLWEALTTPEFTRAYWFGVTLESDWKEGSSWRLVRPDGEVADGGKVLAVEKPKRLVLSWRNEFRPELRAEGYARATFLLEAAGSAVKLVIEHEIEREGSKLIESVSNGWPKILASLKSLLETGSSFEETRRWPK